jgi:biopolymer transport protein ExbD
MRRPPYQRENRGKLDVKMTPMIDVVFQLLIFFVCTVSFQAMEEILPTNLRAQGGVASSVKLDPELAELEEILIKVVPHDGEARWLINGRSYDQLQQVRDLMQQLAEIRTDLPVILDVDPDVALGHVIDVYDLCRRAGFAKIQFAAKAEK